MFFFLTLVNIMDEFRKNLRSQPCQTILFSSPIA